ncbi:MAG: hypothetical protein KAG66_02945, partial [Methylococcales bacterium]|nr:hypothetical protein [Methylococcales bacterium]
MAISVSNHQESSNIRPWWLYLPRPSSPPTPSKRNVCDREELRGITNKLLLFTVTFLLPFKNTLGDQPITGEPDKAFNNSVSIQAAERADSRIQLALVSTTIKKLEQDGVKLETNDISKRPETDEPGSPESALGGFTISGQSTLIYQSSSLNLKSGDLKNSDGTNLSNATLDTYQHKSSNGTFSADLIVEKKIGDFGYFQLDLQFANGPGIDSPLQGGAMVKNDVMEYSPNHNEPYLAKAFYEHTVSVFDEYSLTIDIGKFGVNDFFDVGVEVSDQTTQFLNQAINNNGAFDYVQDLKGHGYTYGVRLGLNNDLFGVDTAFFSSDDYIENIDKKYSVLVGVMFTPEWFPGLRSIYQVYGFTNFGEYARFDGEGNLISKDLDLIDTSANRDNLNKSGFGISINQPLPHGINLFAKYGQQDDTRDVRHYQDMDESYM